MGTARHLLCDPWGPACEAAAVYAIMQARMHGWLQRQE